MRQRRSNDYIQMFMHAVPAAAFSGVTPPTCKSLNYRLGRVGENYKRDTNCNASSSGNLKQCGEREVLLDDFIQTIN